MIILDSMLKSRDITFLTKVRIVKAMVFPVVMYGCESWTIKKAEHQSGDSGAFGMWPPHVARLEFPRETGLILMPYTQGCGGQDGARV